MGFWKITFWRKRRVPTKVDIAVSTEEPGTCDVGTLTEFGNDECETLADAPPLTEYEEAYGFATPPTEYVKAYGFAPPQTEYEEE
jgi:hypothetical protein